MMVSAKMCARRSRGFGVVRRSISGRSSTVTRARSAAHPGGVDAKLRQVDVRRVLEAAGDRVVDPPLEPLEPVVELGRLNRQRDERPLQPRRHDEAAAGRYGRAAATPPAHRPQGAARFGRSVDPR
jgi:hypothetical protein